MGRDARWIIAVVGVTTCVFVAASDDSILHDDPRGAVCVRKWEKGCSSFNFLI